MVCVSVIIPTYNRSKVVTRAIRSVLAQTFSDFELLIIDDSSNKETEMILRGYDDHRISYFKNQSKKGGGASRNLGIKLAKGEYIAFLDDDDEWLPTKLAKQVFLMRKSGGQVAAISTGVRIMISGNRRSTTFMPKSEGRIFRNLLKGNCVGSPSAVLVRRDVLQEIGGFDENLLSWQDNDLWLRISSHYEFKVLKEILVNYYVTASSITKNGKKQMLGKFMFFKKYFELISIDDLKDRFYMEFGESFSLNGNMATGRKYFLYGFLSRPSDISRFIHLFLSFMGYSVFVKVHSLMDESRIGYGLRHISELNT
jgi:glycosyltransferase involved in cell wall biosynthesis